MNDKDLIFYHFKLHEEYNDTFDEDRLEELYTIHEDVKNELIERGYKHESELNFSEANKFQLQLHFRGKSVHGDLRWRNGGLTLFIDKGRIEEEIDSVENGKKILKNKNKYLKDFNDDKIQCEIKDHSGFVDEGVYEEEGWVIVTIDSGTIELGVQKEDFKEYFFDGDILNGRYMIREVNIGGDKVWLFWKPDDQSPYKSDKESDKNE